MMKIIIFTMSYSNYLKKNKIIFYIVLFIIFHNVLITQNNYETIQIINADLMEGQQTETGLIRSYYGNIILRHKNILATCDTAYQYFAGNNAKLLGNVIIKQDQMSLKSSIVRYEGNTAIAYADNFVEIFDGDTYLKANRGRYNTNSLIANFYNNVLIREKNFSILADSARYNRQNKNSEAKGNVIVENDSFLIVSDYLFYHRESKESKNYGNVYFKGKYDNIYLTGDTVINVPKLHYTKASGNPILFQIDSTIIDGKIEFDTLSISSLLMESLRETKESEKYIFTDSVEIVRGNIKARSDKAIYFAFNELFFLEGNPIIWLDSLQLRADSIIVYMPDNELKLIHSFGNAFAASKDDTNDIRRINQLLGESIKIYFSDKKVTRIECIGNAKSLYYLNSEDAFDGVDVSTCDTINIYFENGNPIDIHWLGTVEGEYYPEKMVWKNAEKYYLSEFKWSNNIPTMKNLIFPEILIKNIKNINKKY